MALTCQNNLLEQSHAPSDSQFEEDRKTLPFRRFSSTSIYLTQQSQNQNFSFLPFHFHFRPKFSQYQASASHFGT
ncbi:hypothetical protein V6N11_062726 [Hibiscus sabdariffa]|uniref:Uncharacterized protein n=1 Tax=Hibiscus sabdariffa TaxID=183260 RepID=A0ABR2PTZ2_9ROSI